MTINMLTFEKWCLLDSVQQRDLYCRTVIDANAQIAVAENLLRKNQLRMKTWSNIVSQVLEEKGN